MVDCLNGHFVHNRLYNFTTPFTRWLKHLGKSYVVADQFLNPSYFLDLSIDSLIP